MVPKARTAETGEEWHLHSLEANGVRMCGWNRIFFWEFESRRNR